MTKITILNPAKGVAKELKKIEFMGCIHYKGDKINMHIHELPNEFETIDVLLGTDLNEFDLFICKNKRHNDPLICIGHYNDGIV